MRDVDGELRGDPPTDFHGAATTTGLLFYPPTADKAKHYFL